MDRYGKILAYIYLKDGAFVNVDLVKNGYAMIMIVLPNVKYTELFLELQREVRESGRGARL